MDLGPGREKGWGGGGGGLRKGVLDSLTDLFQGCSTNKLNCFNPILHGLFQVGSTQGGGGGGKGDTKCSRPFSLKRLKLLQSNLVH